MICRCDRATWNEDQGPVCEDFVPGVPEYHRGMCITCFHDETCHRPMTEAEIHAYEQEVENEPAFSGDAPWEVRA